MEVERSAGVVEMVRVASVKGVVAARGRGARSSRMERRRDRLIVADGKA